MRETLFNLIDQAASGEVGERAELILEAEFLAVEADEVQNRQHGLGGSPA